MEAADLPLPGEVFLVESFLVLVLFRRSPPRCRLARITCGPTRVREARAWRDRMVTVAFLGQAEAGRG